MVRKDMGVSFCIITNGERPKKLEILLSSIAALYIPNVEIIICGYLSNPPLNVQYVEDKYSADNALLGRMRNSACRVATQDVIVVADDDVIFHPMFYKNLCDSDLKFDVICSRFLNPDGSRYWDWSISNNIEHRLLPYAQRHPDIYITGGRCILKRYVFDRVQWDEELGFYKGEDVEFSLRVKSCGFSIEFMESLMITHNDWTYSQFDNRVRRVGVIRVSLRFLKRVVGLVTDKVD